MTNHVTVHLTTAAPEDIFIEELPLNWFDNPFLHQNSGLNSLFNNDELAYEPVMLMHGGIPYSILLWAEDAKPVEASFCKGLEAEELPVPLRIFSLDIRGLGEEECIKFGHMLDAHYRPQQPLVTAPGWGILTDEFNCYEEDISAVYCKYVCPSRGDNRMLLPLFESALTPELKSFLTKHTLKGNVSTIGHTVWPHGKD